MPTPPARRSSIAEGVPALATVASARSSAAVDLVIVRAVIRSPCRRRRSLPARPPGGTPGSPGRTRRRGGTATLEVRRRIGTAPRTRSRRRRTPAPGRVVLGEERRLARAARPGRRRYGQARSPAASWTLDACQADAKEVQTELVAPVRATRRIRRHPPAARAGRCTVLGVMADLPRDLARTGGRSRPPRRARRGSRMPAHRVARAPRLRLPGPSSRRATAAGFYRRQRDRPPGVRTPTARCRPARTSGRTRDRPTT